MSKLLLVASSLAGRNSKTAEIAREFIAAWGAKYPIAQVVVRDLGAEPVPHFGGEHLATFMTPEEQRTPEQRALAAASDALIEEVEASDIVVVAAPMYNFTIPSTLKAWIDHITRAGRTFRYTAEGPVGLLKGKKVFVVAGRGGIYTSPRMKALDFQEPYLSAVFGLIGLTDITFIHLEGLAISPQEAMQGLARARAAIGAIVPAANAA